MKANINRISAPIPVVRIAFIGLGGRGAEAVERMLDIENSSVATLCDFRKENVDSVLEKLASQGCGEPFACWGEDSWKEACERPDVDLVYICTPWHLHAEQAIYAMEHGKHVAVEVPAAMTLEDCHKLVRTAEQTGKHCIMLENSVYGEFELNAINMARKGVLGELVHAECGYLHLFDPQRELWRHKYNMEHRGDLYPTHGIAPVSLALGIGREDRMVSLVSMDSASFLQKDKYNGDHTVTVIRTALGRTILMQHDISLPRPYSRGFLLSGTRGMIAEYPVPQLYLDSESKSAEQIDALMKEYRHPFLTEGGRGDWAKTVGRHDGMDSLMDYRLINALHNGLPLDMNVYEAALWSSLIELTEMSIDQGFRAVDIPDFGNIL